MAIVDISQQMLLLLHVDSTQTLNIHLQVYFIAVPCNGLFLLGYTPCSQVSNSHTPGQKLCLVYHATDISTWKKAEIFFRFA